MSLDFTTVLWTMIAAEIAAYGYAGQKILNRDRKWHWWYIFPLVGTLVLATCFVLQINLVAALRDEALMAIPNYNSDRIQNFMFWEIVTLSAGPFFLIGTWILWIWNRPAN